MNNDAMSQETPPMQDPSQSFPGLALRVWAILGDLRRAIGAWGGRDRAAAATVPLVWTRVGRIAARFAALMAKLAAGPLPPPRVRVQTRRRAEAAKAPVNATTLPRRFGWLMHSVPEAAAFGSQLQALLDAPATRTLLAGCPQAERILRPLRHMLGLPQPGAPARLCRKAMAASRKALAEYHRFMSARTPTPPADPVGFFPGRPPPCWTG